MGKSAFNQSEEHRAKMRAQWDAQPKCTFRHQSGERCKNLSQKTADKTPTGFCYSHSKRRKARRGVGAQAFKTGRYSLVLPKNIAEKYEHHLSDKELVNLRTDIALIRARRDDLLANLKEGDSRGFVKMISRAIKQGKLDVKAKLITEATLIARIETILTEEIAEYLKWEEINDCVDRITRLVAAEAKRMKDMNAVLTLEQALAFVANLAAIARKHMDEEKMNLFTREMASSLQLAMPNFEKTEIVDARREFVDGEEIEVPVEGVDEEDEYEDDEDREYASGDSLKVIDSDDQKYQ